MYSVWALVVKVGWFLEIMLDMGFKVHVFRQEKRPDCPCKMKFCFQVRII
jgi:hypothetical protein